MVLGPLERVRPKSSSDCVLAGDTCMRCKVIGKWLLLMLDIGLLSNKYGTLRPYAAYLVFVNLWEILGESAATERNLGGLWSQGITRAWQEVLAWLMEAQNSEGSVFPTKQYFHLYSWLQFFLSSSEQSSHFNDTNKLSVTWLLSYVSFFATVCTSEL